ncbi:hypothetical protein HDU86_008217 [Geranomyces michiganensis]|nr:hypothetical protein HDU86_008217 [Geranomyces michiganensis]
MSTLSSYTQGDLSVTPMAGKTAATSATKFPWVFGGVSVAAEDPIDSSSSSSKRFKPNATATYSLPGNLGLALKAGEGASLNVTVSPDPPTGLQAPDKGIATYYKFDLSTTSTFSANLTFVYVDDSYDPGTLAWARFNEDTQKWESQRGTVDKVAKTVTLETSKFSTWTVVSVTSAATRGAFAPCAFLIAAFTTIMLI